MSQSSMSQSVEVPLGHDPSWGAWMMGWTSLENQDEEQTRIDRQKAAFGAETLQKLKDLNVLVVGVRGVGVEAAKNLILTNVGAVVLWDGETQAVARPCDLGTNFYLSEADVDAGCNRLDSCLPQLKSLNPYCKVEAASGALTDEFLTQKNVLATKKPFAAVILTQLLPRQELIRINETCRNAGIAFLMATNFGVTATLFSDFGPRHIINDTNGESTQTLAIARLEVLRLPPCLKVHGVNEGEHVAIVSASDAHGLDDGDVIKLDDMHGSWELERLNNREVKVKRVYLRSPANAKVTNEDLRPLLKEPTTSLAASWQRQFDAYKAEAEAGDKKMCVREISLQTRLALVLEDLSADTASNFGIHTNGGLFTQVKQPVEVAYRSFAETLERTPVPDMPFKEHAEAGSGIEIHLAIAATLDFLDQTGHVPRLHNAEDATAVVNAAKRISDERKQIDGACYAQQISYGFPTGETRELNEVVIRRFASLFEAELTGFCAFLGGAVAQEVIKKTGKYTPINQWIHHDDQALVADECLTNTGPLLGSRYDYQIAILGKQFQESVAGQRVFLVGCGALGCEYLKGMALMGVATNSHGKVTVADMDTIEISNLSRQFLFRRPDVQKSKAECGARVVKGWNPDFNVQPVLKRVGPDSEDFFSDEFWTGLDVCWNALDNVEARKYTDGRCLWYGKPLLESGTLGTASNSEVVLPFRSSTYNDAKDTDQAAGSGIAMCTLRSFPYLPLHCIEFAKQALWSDYFEFAPEQYEAYRTDPDGFFERLEDMSDADRASALIKAKQFVDLQKDGPVDFDACVRLAFGQMIDVFRNGILDVQHLGDEAEKSGKPFWTGTKRRPNAVNFSVDSFDEGSGQAMEYLYAASNLYAHVFGTDPVRHRSEFSEIVRYLDLQQNEWRPSGKKIAVDEDDEEDSPNAAADVDLAVLQAELEAVDVSSLQPVHSHDFEKDDDQNFHVDFLTAAANLRSWNYNIKLSERHWVKVTAGNIIPALATTTAMVCGLNCIEFCKLALGLQNAGVNVFLNSNINLATGSNAFNLFNPDPPVEMRSSDAADAISYTSWDKIVIRKASVRSLVEWIKRRFNVTVQSLFAPGKENMPLFSELDLRRLEWTIEWSEGYGKGLKFSPACTERWPELGAPMTKMLLAKPADSNAFKMTAQKIDRMIAALAEVKASAKEQFEGSVLDAYFQTYQPKPGSAHFEEVSIYFDRLWANRGYVPLVGHFVDDEGHEVNLPPFRVVVDKRSSPDDRSDEDASLTKRSRS